VQRLFSTFPQGLPGTGLLLLRMASGIALLQPAAAGLVDHAPVSLPAIAASCVAVLLLLGLWTPAAGVFATLAELALAYSDPARAAGSVQTAASAAALAMLGPGAWSVDARLFGRRHIEIPMR
jgi:hypothetical protein